MNTDLKTNIIQLRSEGLSYRGIQKELNCSRGTISYHLSKEDNHLDLINQNRLRPIRIPTSKEDTLIYLLEQGICRTNIADVLNIDSSEIELFIKRNNLPGKPKGLNGYTRVKLRRRHLKLLAVVYKGGKCIECGYLKCLRSMDFHHLDPSQKDFSISANANRAWNNVKSELDKCILICKNCHGELHESLDNAQLAA
jgi:hypothetical protein